MVLLLVLLKFVDLVSFYRTYYNNKKALIHYISRLYRTISYYIELEFGGDNRDRTDDLLNAIQALSQLSYIPIKNSNMIKFDYVAVNTILLCVCYPIKY